MRFQKFASGILLGTACLVSSSIAAEDASPSDELKHTLGAIEYVSAKFSQTVYDEQEVVYEATGALYLAKPGKVRWETEYPDEALMIADGESIWNIDTFVEQVTVLDQSQSVENNPIVLLTSQDESVWDDFSISKVEQLETLGMADVSHGFYIKSLQDSPQIEALTLYFNNDTIVGMSTLDSQGQLSQLAFNSVNTRDPIAASMFEPNFPDSYTLDDQR